LPGFHFCYSQQTDTSNRKYSKSEPGIPKYVAPTVTSKTVNEKKDLIINTKMDTLSVIFQNTLIPIRSFSQLDSFVRFNLMGMAKPGLKSGATQVTLMKIMTGLSKF